MCRDIGLLACVAALLLGSILAVLFYHGQVRALAPLSRALPYSFI